MFCRYFENYKNVGEFLDLDLLDHLGDTILVNERLMFLGGSKINDSNMNNTVLCVPLQPSIVNIISCLRKVRWWQLVNSSSLC